VVVDDAQWLDASTTFVLEFALRRTIAEPIGVLVVQRGGRSPLGDALARELPEERLQRIQLGPLSVGALHRVLHSRLGAALARPTLFRVHRASRGNPLYGIEIARLLAEAGTVTCGAFAEPSDGLEPSTPSLPSRLRGDGMQPEAAVRK
jgi:hypothetical protein